MWGRWRLVVAVPVVWCMWLAAGGTAVAGTTAPGVLAGGDAVRLQLARPRPVSDGGLAVFAGRVLGLGRCRVVVERRVGRRWVVTASGVSGGSGRFALTWIVSARPGRVGVRAVAYRGARIAAISTVRTLVLGMRRGGAPVVSPRAAVLAGSTVTSAPAPGQAGELRYSGGDSVHVGQIVAVGDSTATPHGYLGTVTGVSSSGGETVVSTSPASLAQVVRSGSFDVTASSGRPAFRGPVAHTASVRVQCKGVASASVTASVSVGASIRAKGSFGFFSVRSAILTGDAHASASLDADLGAAGSCKLKKTTLFTIPGPKAVFSIGPIPVVLTSEIPVYLDAGAEIDGKLSTSISGGFDAQAGIGWDHSRGFYPIHAFTPNFSFTQPTVSGGARVDANLTPTVEVMVDGFATANLALTAGLALEANIASNPWWTLTAPVSLTASLELSIPALLHLSSPTLTLYSHTFQLADAGGPFGPTPPPPPPPPQPTLSIVAGNGISGPPTAGPAIQSELGEPTDVALDPNGDLYITDLEQDVVEEVTPSGQLSIIAGQVGQAGTPTPGPATASWLDFSGDFCGGIAVDRSGDVFVADCGNDVVEEITPSGQLSIVAGQVGQAGPPTPGPATSSDLDDPAGVAVDGAGNLYIADNDNDVIEKVAPSGQLSIIAGQVGQSGTPTPGTATNSEIGAGDIAADAAGDVIIADTDNNVVEEVTPSGQLSIIAGQVGQQGTPTPGPATSSDLDFGGCGQVAVDTSGDVYIADCTNDAVEKVSAAGQLSVIAGEPGQAGQPTPGSATSSELDGPSGLAVDGTGDVFIADSGNAVVEEVKPATGG
jgi:hypothetical protein